jgi:hypothetical protein
MLWDGNQTSDSEDNMLIILTSDIHAHTSCQESMTLLSEAILSRRVETLSEKVTAGLCSTDHTRPMILKTLE